MKTQAKGRAAQVGPAVPRLSHWERELWLDRAEAVGFRPREVCDCEQPTPGFGGGNRFYISRVCLNLGCQRRLRREEEQ